MSLGRPSQSPAGPSRLPIYLTDAPITSASSIRSPRVSASSRNGIKRSSAFESFDAPAYCNDMAQFIADQLAAKPRRPSKRDQEIEASRIEDRWRGSQGKGGHAELAGVSVQTTVDEVGSLYEANHTTDLDFSRTEQKKAEADAFLRQLQAQPDELTEAERRLEGDVLSFFAADVLDQSSEADESAESEEDLPEVNAHIAGMLAEKEKSTRSGPLIEEVEVRQGGPINESSSSGEEESESESEEEEEGEEEEGEEEEEETERYGEDQFDSEGEEMRSYEQRRDALMQSSIFSDGIDELEEEVKVAGGSNYNENLYANGRDLYEDDEQNDATSASDEPIELSDSDEEEAHEDEEIEEGVDQLGSFDSGADGDTVKLDFEADEDEEMVFEGVQDAEARPSESMDYDPYNSADMLDLDNAWTNENEAVNEPTSHQSAVTTANLFEQPSFDLGGYTDGVSSFAPLQHDSPPPQSAPDIAVETSLGPDDEMLVGGQSPVQEAQETLVPSVPPYLQHAEDGAGLFSMKQDLIRNDSNISQAASVSAQPGTPQRAGSSEQLREAIGGHARHAKDLLHIKSVALETLQGQASLATSLASDIDTAPHHSDVGSIDSAPKLQSQFAEAFENAEPEVIEEALAQDDMHKEPSLGESYSKAQEEFKDDLVDYVEAADVATTSYEAGDDLDIQSFAGSHASDHVYGLEERGSSLDPDGLLITITEEVEEDQPSAVVQEQSEEKQLEIGKNSIEAERDERKEEAAQGELLPSPTITKNSLRKSTSRAPSEVAPDLEPAEQRSDPVASPTITKQSLRKPSSRAPSEVAFDMQSPEDKVEPITSPTITKKSLRKSLSREPGDVAAEMEPQEEEEPLPSPTITKQSLRKSVSRAPSEAAESPRKAAPKSKRGRRSRTVTIESHSKSIRSVSRAASEAASGSSPRKNRHHTRKSDASNDLADFVPEPEDQEENESERPTKRHKMEENGTGEETAVGAVAEIDEEMLDTSILEEDDSMMQVDEAPEEQVEATAPKARPPRKSKTTPRKSADPTFRVKKVEESDSDEDKEVKVKKEEQIKKRREADREHRRELREAKRLEKEQVQKEEKEAEKAAAGLLRKSRLSEDVKSYRPKADEVAEEEEQEEQQQIFPEETIAKRRSKRKAA